MLLFVLTEALQNILFFGLHFDGKNSFPPPLPQKEEQECLLAAAKGDLAARDKLIKHNLRLVAFIVKKHYSDYRDPDDLVSIGTIGLIKAAETFDPDRAINFSTYAGKCINNQIRMFFRKIKHVQNEVYMNEPVDCDKDGNEVTLADIFRDPVDIEELAELRIDIKKLYRYIEEELDPREKEIIAKRYGIAVSGYKPERIMTQHEVAEDMNISRSYVSRIEKKALEKLRSRFKNIV